MKEELYKLLDNSSSMLECKCGRHIENIIVNEEFNDLIINILTLFNKRIDDSKGKIYSTIFNSDVLCSVDNVNQLTRDIINIIKKEVGK